MKAAFGRSHAALILVATALLCLACNETPTEPVSLPATMSGLVFNPQADPVAGAIVECQGRTMTTSSSGAFGLTGLMSGKTTVTLKPTELVPIHFQIVLRPGSNTVDLFLP